MSLILTGLLIVQVLSALTIIVLVLLQQGKGSDMGSAFGGGSAGSLFGAAGAANFLSRATKWAAILFFAVTLGLAYFGTAGRNVPAPVGVMDEYQAVDPSVPQLPGDAGAGGDAAIPQPPAPAGDASVPAPVEPAPDAVPAPAPEPEAPTPEAAAPSVAPATESPAPAPENANNATGS